MIELQKQKQAVADAGRMLVSEGLAARTWGNVSCRTASDSFVITPSGLAYESMSAGDIVEFNMKTGEWKGSRKPSSEKGIHAAAYELFPEAGFVIHTHQNYASALGLAGFNNIELIKEEKSALGGLELAAYGLPGTKKLCKNVRAALESGAHCILMAHHGALVVGKDQDEAFERARLLEALCKRNYKGVEKQICFECERAERLVKLAKDRFGYAAYSSASALLNAAENGDEIKAQLDDMAQMIGRKMFVIRGDDRLVIQALEKCEAVLLPRIGVLCRANSEGDCDSLCKLAEKAGIAYLHTKALGCKAGLSLLDACLMRVVYTRKYSKKIGE